MKKFTEEISNASHYEYSFSFTQDDVNGFAEISGDKNPIHLDEEFAAKSFFKKRIIHGFLGASVFSKIFAMVFPGKGTIYLKQDLKFMEPMFTKEEYKAFFTVTNHIKDKHRALVLTEIKNSNNDIVITGEALIQNKKFL